MKEGHRTCYHRLTVGGTNKRRCENALRGANGEISRGGDTVHGQLKEVAFLEANKDSLLVFSDGTLGERVQSI